MYKLIGWLFLLAPVSFAAGQGTGEWKEFASKNGGYQVLMPGAPKEHQRSTKTSFGTIYLSLAALELKKDEAGYNVSFADLPEPAVKETEERRLDNARDGAIKDSRGKLKSEKAIKLDGHPGRELLIELEGKPEVIRLRMFAVKNRFYQVMAYGTAALVASPDTEKFFGSFKLVK